MNEKKKLLLNSGKDVFGQQLFNYTNGSAVMWTCPAGVKFVSAVCVGTPASNGGGGAGLGWKNRIPVVPGQQYTVVVGEGGVNGSGDSYFISKSLVCGGGTSNTTGGTFVGDGGGNGGDGQGRGGGGAGGYRGVGGVGGALNQYGGRPQLGSGGGGGGAGGTVNNGGGGGGVGLLGLGPDGSADSTSGSPTSGGGGGSGGTNGNSTAGAQNGIGGTYGGGSAVQVTGRALTKCGVRLIWGRGRAFPNRNTADK